jgi:hypothetical protein
LEWDSNLVVTALLDRDDELLSGERMARFILGKFGGAVETLSAKLPDVLKKESRRLCLGSISAEPPRNASMKKSRRVARIR